MLPPNTPRQRSEKEGGNFVEFGNRARIILGNPPELSVAETD